MHPDGWYWVAPDGEQQFGPFESAELARRERDRFSEQAVVEPADERAAEQALNVSPATDEDRSDRAQWSGEESP